MLAHVPRARASHWGIAAAGVVATVTWLTLHDYQATEAGSSSNSWLWVSLFGIAAAFAAFSSYYGVAVAAESRSSRLRFLYRGRPASAARARHRAWPARSWSVCA